MLRYTITIKHFKGLVMIEVRFLQVFLETKNQVIAQAKKKKMSIRAYVQYLVDSDK